MLNLESKIKSILKCSQDIADDQEPKHLQTKRLELIERLKVVYTESGLLFRDIQVMVDLI